MRKIVIGLYAGCVGTESWEFWLVPEHISDSELNEAVWHRAIEYAEGYGMYYLPYYEDELSEEELDSDSYTNDIEGWWHNYDPIKHDRYTIGGAPNWETYS
jgi:hypothetical protein